MRRRFICRRRTKLFVVIVLIYLCAADLELQIAVFCEFEQGSFSKDHVSRHQQMSYLLLCCAVNAIYLPDRPVGQIG